MAQLVGTKEFLTAINTRVISDREKAAFNAIVNYKEKTFHHFYHNLKVFVNGFDVSSMMTGSLEVSYGLEETSNSCSFRLVSSSESFILNEMDVKYIIKGENPMYDGGGDFAFKNHCILFKFNPGTKNDFENTLINTCVDRAGVKGTDYRFCINVPGVTIVNKYDFVRVFAHNPYCGEDVDSWVPLFTGHVSDAPISYDFLTGESSLQISCSDIREMMEHMRVSWSSVKSWFPGWVFKNAGLFSDVLNPGFYGQGLLGLRFPTAVKTIIAGNGGAVAPIGRFTMGDTASLKPVRDKDVDTNALLSWHQMTLLGTWRRPLSEYEVDTAGLMSGHDGMFRSIDMRCHILQPKSEVIRENLFDFSQRGVQDSYDWITRLAMLKDLCDRAAYTFFVSPIGDIVVEPLLGDFNHIDFGSMKETLVVDMHSVNCDFNDDANPPPAAMTVQGGFGLIEANLNANAAAAILTAYARSNIVALRYGPDVDQRTYSYINATSDAGKRSLALMAKIEYTKLIGSSSSLTFSSMFRYGLLPNRPLLFLSKLRLGRINSVSLSYDIGVSANVTANLDYIRWWDPENKIGLFTVTGSTALPVSVGWGLMPTGETISTYAGLGFTSLDQISALVQSTTPDPECLRPDFRERVYSWIDDMETVYKIDVNIFSACRTFAWQRAAYIRAYADEATALKALNGDKDAMKQRRGYVAKPGESMHNYGLAVDCEFKMIGEDNYYPGHFAGPDRTRANIAGKGIDWPHNPELCAKWWTVYLTAARVAEKHGISWRYKENDPMHFEMADYTATKARATSVQVWKDYASRAEQPPPASGVPVYAPGEESADNDGAEIQQDTAFVTTDQPEAPVLLDPALELEPAD